MRILLMLVLCAPSWCILSAQTTREHLKNDLFRAGSNYYAYPEPSAKLTPAPKGKKPFYISTYARNGADLRFGHETIVLPLTCLLGLNGYDRQFMNLEELDTDGWINFDVFPMAANIQFVFYRKDAKDKDVLLKILLNENEATLPIPTDCAPYYHWKDFREFYMNKLNSYQE